jgi:hypothetical protein
MDDFRLTTATGTFTVDSWRDEPVADPGEDGATDPATKIGWVQLSKTFLGDLAGHSTVDMLSVIVAGEPAGYVAIERVGASLHGRAGRFVLQHSATADGAAQALRIEVVPRSGSGELAGLSGVLEIIRADDGSHSYAFHYRLADATATAEPS